MTKVIRTQLVMLFALVAALVLTLAACGGGSSSSGFGGGSGGTITGTVSSGTAAILPSGHLEPVLASVMDLVIEPVHAAPVADVTVVLKDSAGKQIETQKTGPTGTFTFMVPEAGDYIVEVAGADIPVTVGPAGSTQSVEVTTGGGTLMVQVNTDGTAISGAVDDDSSDGMSDDDSIDDDSIDDDSIDDDSVDDDSVDDGDSGATV